MTTIIKDKNKKNERKLEFDKERLLNFIHRKANETDLPKKVVDDFAEKIVRKVERRTEIEAKNISKIMVEESLVLVKEVKDENGRVTSESLKSIEWNKFARSILQNQLYKRASRNRSYDADKKYGNFLGHIISMTEKGLYTPDLLTYYSHEEINEIGKMIDPSKDELFDYIGLYSLSERYLVSDFDKSVLELPQERFLIIAMHLMMLEDKENRLDYIREMYFVLSNLLLTVATPTLINAGRVSGGLSSCHIVTTEDSLRGIYDDNTDIATFSKHGAGIGTYLGKLRATGSDIKGFNGVSSGIIGWLKQLDNTALSVDQLGSRPGAIAAYLDVWHKDIGLFNSLRLQTGDHMKRAYQLFTGVCIPDEFMRQVKKRGDWYLFDPHEIKKVMGYSLEDYYDEKKLEDKETPNPNDHAWTYRYYECIDNDNIKKKRGPAIEIMKQIMKHQFETGIPYMFYRDEVNRKNPNKHEGIIYSSNLCSEIAQNMTPSSVTKEVIDEENGQVIIYKDSGDLVTCNLSSLVINRIMEDDDDKLLERVIKIQMRALDNVISLNRLEVPQATITNTKYRAVGAGEQGIAALLADKKIMWDSDKATDYINKLEEKIMLYTIKHSALLGKEKGSYPVFEGSEWNTGKWIDNLPTTLDEWSEVKELSMQYMRNSYLRAVAPTGGTSVIAGSTPGVDPIFDVIYQEEKGTFMLPVVVPKLSAKTWFFYKPTMKMEYEGEKQLAHMWAVKHNEVRQIWVDQAISFNSYVPRKMKAVNMLKIHEEVWNRNIKTTYYTRQWDTRKEDACLACSS